MKNRSLAPGDVFISYDENMEPVKIELVRPHLRGFPNSNIMTDIDEENYHYA